MDAVHRNQLEYLWKRKAGEENMKNQFKSLKIEKEIDQEHSRPVMEKHIKRETDPTFQFKNC